MWLQHLLEQALGYLSGRCWVLVLGDSRELGSAVLSKRNQLYESIIYKDKKYKSTIYHVYIKTYLLTSLVGAGVGGSVGLAVGPAVVGAFVG